MNQIAKRLRGAIKFLKEQGKIAGHEDVARILGYKRVQSIGDMISENATPTTKFVSSFAAAFSISKNWLETGDGDMLATQTLSGLNDAQTLQGDDLELQVKESGRKQVTVLGKHVPSRLRPDEHADAFGDWEGLPIFNEPITASFVATYRDTSVHVPQYYLHDPRFRDCDFGAIITGDSMHPEIRHGDIVACKLINDTTFIVFGDIYYIVASNGLETCKYVQRVKKLREGAEKRGRGGSRARYDDADVIYEDDKVLLVPYNTAIDPSPILKEMIDRLYKVRGIIRGY